MTTQVRRKAIEYTCEDCGKTFQSGRRRSGPLYCASCVEERRKVGLGPRQTAPEGRAGHVVVGGARYKVLIYPAEEGGFWGKAPQFPGCFSQGGSEEELRANLEDAVAAVIEASGVQFEDQIRLSVEEFVQEAPRWHAKYLAHNPGVPALEEAIGESRARGYLDRSDLKGVVLWGGNPYGMWGKIDRRNSDERIARCSSEAIELLADPEAALERITGIHGLGASFGSKALAFLSPQTCPILDSVIDKGCLIWADNWTHRYADLAALCGHIAARQPGPNPARPKGAWYVRDAEMALFQFAWRGPGEPGRYIVGKLPLGGADP